MRVELTLVDECPSGVTQPSERWSWVGKQGSHEAAEAGSEPNLNARNITFPKRNPPFTETLSYPPNSQIKKNSNPKTAV